MDRQKIPLGFPRMHLEPGERRDFLPDFMSRLLRYSVNLVLEEGYGSGMGLSHDDYISIAPSVRFVSHEETYRQPYVIVLRCPGEDKLQMLEPGSCLISMLHYPTRPGRVSFIRSLGVESISLDSIKDDSGRRLIENLRAVAWNGVETAFQLLGKLYPPPGFDSPERPPLYVTLLGAGAVGGYVMPAAVRYGNEKLRAKMVSSNVPGVQVNVVDYDITAHEAYIRPLLARTDILVDATQRPDPSIPVVPNEWIADLPAHAVILDLSVDPYEYTKRTRLVKGIEGIPHGNLDQYVFRPDDPVYESLPDWVNSHNRRHVVSCYSWPGIYPEACMQVYGRQLQPILRVLIQKGGIRNVNPAGGYFERAIARALLSRYRETG